MQNSIQFFIVTPCLCFFSDYDSPFPVAPTSAFHPICQMDPAPCSQSSFLIETPMILIHKTLSSHLTK